MKAKHAFQPATFDRLESREVLSTVGPGVPHLLAPSTSLVPPKVIFSASGEPGVPHLLAPSTSLVPPKVIFSGF